MIPDPILQRGPISIPWHRAKTTSSLNYPLPGKDRWLPSGTRGWARHISGGFSFVPDEPVEPFNHSGGFAVSARDIELSDGFVRVTYCLAPQPAEKEVDGG